MNPHSSLYTMCIPLCFAIGSFCTLLETLLIGALSVSCAETVYAFICFSGHKHMKILRLNSWMAFGVLKEKFQRFSTDCLLIELG